MHAVERNGALAMAMAVAVCRRRDSRTSDHLLRASRWRGSVGEEAEAASAASCGVFPSEDGGWRRRRARVVVCRESRPGACAGVFHRGVYCRCGHTGVSGRSCSGSVRRGASLVPFCE